PIAVPADAPLQDRVLGLIGRDPGWTPETSLARGQTCSGALEIFLPVGQSASMATANPPTVEDAIALAARVHRGQRYPSPDGEPYVFHPLRVMLRFLDPVEQMASVLHDAIEDTDLSIDELVHAGYPAPVVAAIDCLTHRGSESYEQYIDRVAS